MIHPHLFNSSQSIFPLSLFFYQRTRLYYIDIFTYLLLRCFRYTESNDARVYFPAVTLFFPSDGDDRTQELSLFQCSDDFFLVMLDGNGIPQIFGIEPKNRVAALFEQYLLAFIRLFPVDVVSLAVDIDQQFLSGIGEVGARMGSRHEHFVLPDRLKQVILLEKLLKAIFGKGFGFPNLSGFLEMACGKDFDHFSVPRIANSVQNTDGGLSIQLRVEALIPICPQTAVA